MPKSLSSKRTAIFAAGRVRREVAAVDLALGVEARQVRQRPRVLLVVRANWAVPLPGEELRHLLLVQVRLGGERLLGADLVEHQEDLVLLDQAPCLLDGLGRVVAVVEVAVLDLPAVDAAVVVHVLEVGGRAVGDDRVGGLGAAERHGAADQDRARGDARGVGGRRAGDAGRAAAARASAASLTRPPF